MVQRQIYPQENVCVHKANKLALLYMNLIKK